MNTAISTQTSTSHIDFRGMILAAIQEGDKSGRCVNKLGFKRRINIGFVSYQQISKYIQKKYTVTEQEVKVNLAKTIREMVEGKELVRLRRSYRLLGSNYAKLGKEDPRAKVINPCDKMKEVLTVSFQNEEVEVPHFTVCDSIDLGDGFYIQ